MLCCLTMFPTVWRCFDCTRSSCLVGRIKAVSVRASIDAACRSRGKAPPRLAKLRLYTNIDIDTLEYPHPIPHCKRDSRIAILTSTYRYRYCTWLQTGRLDRHATRRQLRPSLGPSYHSFLVLESVNYGALNSCFGRKDAPSAAG